MRCRHSRRNSGESEATAAEPASDGGILCRTRQSGAGSARCAGISSVWNSSRGKIRSSLSVSCIVLLMLLTEISPAR